MSRTRNFKKQLPRFVAEIGVVIIGILLWLLISNWVQNGQDRKKEVTYLRQIKNDLKDDLAQLNSDLALRERQLAYVNKTLGEINDPEKAPNPFESAGGFQGLVTTLRFQPNDVTFRSLESTGRLGLLTNQKVIAGLIGLYTDYYHALELNNEDLNLYRDNFLLPYLNEKLDFNGALFKRDIATLKSILADWHFTNHLVYQQISGSSSVGAYRRTIAAVEEVIELVEEETE